MLDDLEEGGLIEQVGLEIGCVDRDQPLRGGRDLVDRRANLGEGGENRQGLGPLARHGGRAPRAGGFRRIARVRELRQSTVQVKFPGYCHEWRPAFACMGGRLTGILVTARGFPLPNRSRFGGRICSQ